MANEDTAFRVRSSYQRQLEPGQSLGEGESRDHLYVVQSGEIEVTRPGPQGARVVARLGPGDFFGELALFQGRPDGLRAVAVRPTRVLELDRETLEGMCLAQPQIAIRLIRILVARLIEAERRLALLGADDLMRPMVRAILRAAESAGEDGFRVRARLRGLSEESGLSMLESHRALQQLFEQRLVEIEDDELRVPDLEALSAVLENAA